MTENVDDLFDDEVTTGATLDSGTTVGGNQVYHLGNDGQGSGLDAEKVDGSDVASSGDTWTLSPSMGTFGNVQTKFSTPCSSPFGIDIDENGCLWHSDYANYDESIYKMDKSGTVESKAVYPGIYPQGLAFDSTDSIWHCDSTASSIYKTNKSASVIKKFASQSTTPNGIGFDESDSIWYAEGDSNSESIYQLDQSGTAISQFVSPSDQPTGVTIGQQSCIWSADEDNSIYKLNTSGSIITQYSFSPANVLGGITFDSSNSIWISEDGGSSIYKTTSAQTSYSLNTKQ